MKKITKEELEEYNKTLPKGYRYILTKFKTGLILTFDDENLRKRVIPILFKRTEK